jgi:adenylate cyclase
MLAMSEPRDTTKVPRRLAAILVADIAGYSALIGADEARTVRDLKDRLAIVLPMISGHGGRVIDTAGDGILAEFGSVVNAVECAAAIQKTMMACNAGVEDGRQMQFRIGINIGDVIHDESRLYGDGVNIAARLEAIAEPGGICISGATYEQVRNKLALEVTDLGLQSLKNIAQPVRIYRITTEPYLRPAQAKPLLALPDKPSIAVLPFANLSGDPQQEYLADGIVEDIITELSRFSELFVIARNSSFQYKGKSPDIRHVGRELGVRYVLEGSIRRAGDRIRISAQLIDAVIGAHRWGERYDRELKDIFAVQDEVSRAIVTNLAAHVNRAETERTLLKPPATWQAYDFLVRASDIFNAMRSSFNVADLYEARRLLERSIALDPHYARAYATFSNTHLFAFANPVDEDCLSAAALERAHLLARKAVQLDPNLPIAHASLGSVLSFEGQHEQSIAAFEKAIALNPNFTDPRFGLALLRAGEPARGAQVIETHMRYDPFYAPLVPGQLGLARFMLKEYSEALPPLRECTSRAPDMALGHVWLAANLAQLGQLDGARAEAAEVLRIDPKYTIDGTQRRLALFKRREDAEHLLNGLRKAGLPET